MNVPALPGVGFRYMGSHRGLFTLVICLFCTSGAAALEQLPVPGGAGAIRSATGLPDSVPDGMLLVEATRAWYGSKDPVRNPTPEVRRLLEHMNASTEPLAPGPVLPLDAQTWSTMLMLRQPQLLFRALVNSRNAMFLYHGLMGMDDETLRWIGGDRWLLRHLYDEAAATFAFAGPAIRVRNGSVLVPGGDSARAAWESIVGEPVSKPSSFVRSLMDRRDGRLAWLYSVLSDLDAPRLAFALGPGANQLEALERAASSTAPEWKIDERPFWRPAFDFSLVLALVDVRNGGPRGSYGFWREVFGSTDLERWRGQQGDPLTSGTLIELLFEHPYTARERWDLFALGQRTPGVERNDPQAGLLLRGARLHPSLGLALDRVGVRDLALGVALHRASARVTARDEIGTRGELVVWQGVLAMLERASLTGGLDAASLRTAFEELAALKLDDPRAELTAWLMGRFVPSLAGRPGAPADTERALLETIGGALTPHGRRKHEAFSWEDLSYVIASNEASARVMSTVRGAQGPLTLDEAKLAWDISSGATEEAAPLADRLTASAIRDVALHGRRMQEALKERDVESLRREAARAAETITSLLLPAFAYSPHLAASEMPELGADIAFRHELGPHSDAASTKVLRPWQLARGHARDDSGWHLQGSLLGLEVAVSNWYLRRNGEPPTAAPVFDEPDVLAFALVPALLHLRGVEGLGLAEAAAAIDAGRRRASAASDLRALDDMLRDAGIDPWRRRALRVDGKTPAEVADELSATESWRLGGAPGRFAPRGPLDGCLCLGETTHSTFILEGRRSSGMIGAGAVDVQLRTAVFLRKHQLPEQLFGGVIAGALLQMIENTRAARPDDFQAIAAAVSSIEDTRMEEHLLALVGDGTLARPSSKDN